MRFAPWLFVSSIGAACALPSTDEYSSGTPDGGTSSSSSSSGAPAAEAGLPDADDASEAAPPLDDDAGSPPLVCPDGADYCEDFSQRTAAQVGVLDVDPASNIEVIDEVVHASIPAHPEEGHYSAELSHFVSNALKVTAEIDMKVAPTGPFGGGNMAVFAIAYDGKPNNHGFELYLDGASSSITTTENGGNLIYDNASIDLPRGRWVHVKIDADFTPGSGGMRLSYDGQLAAIRNGIAFSASTNVALQVRVGLRRNNAPTPALTVLYDNLVITLPK